MVFKLVYLKILHPKGFHDSDVRQRFRQNRDDVSHPILGGFALPLEHIAQPGNQETGDWKQNTDKIAGVIEQQRLLRHEIDSLKMGIVFLDDAFNRLAADYNLTELKVDMDSKQAEGASMPVKTSFKGTLKNGLDAIQKIQTEYLFIPFRSIKIEEENTEKTAKFDILMDYKYHLKNI